jgi:hypothetical protein
MVGIKGKTGSHWKPFNEYKVNNNLPNLSYREYKERTKEVEPVPEAKQMEEDLTTARGEKDDEGAA